MFPLDTDSCHRFTYIPVQVKIPTHTLLGLWIFLQGWKGCNFPVRRNFLYFFFFLVKHKTWISELKRHYQNIMFEWLRSKIVWKSFFLETSWFLFLFGEFGGNFADISHQASLVLDQPNVFAFCESLLLNRAEKITGTKVSIKNNT